MKPAKPIEIEELAAVYARQLEVEPPEEQWLIRDLWGRSAVGVIGGSPKCCKSFFGIDLAVSVASGTPALGKFAVEAPGTALIYLAEDALPQVRLRLEALCRHRQLDLENLNLVVITEPFLHLDMERDQKRLRATIDRFKPRLLLLDPLVRLHSLDENSAHEVSSLLSYFRELQRTFDLALILVHHTSKKKRSQIGQSLRGSSDLHAFGDSNAYLTRRGEEIILTLEHRSARSPAPLALELVASDQCNDIHLEWRGEASVREKQQPQNVLLIELLERHEKPLSRTEIRSRLHINNQRLGELLKEFERSGEIIRTQSGWTARAKRSAGPQDPAGEKGENPAAKK
jgi:hypothetical protein